MTRRNKRRVYAGVWLLAVATGAVAAFVGWFSTGASWQTASGYTEALALGLQEESRLGADEPKIVWLGHGGFLIELDGKRFAFDPILSDRCTIVPRLTSEPLIAADQIPALDAVLIGHSHYDHLDLPTLEAIPNIAEIVMPSGSEVFLSAAIRAKSSVTPLAISASKTFGSVTVTAVPTVHNGSRHHPFTSAYQAQGYILKGSRDTIYLSGDTGWSEHFKRDRRDALLQQLVVLPIGGFEPYFILHKYHLSPEDAARAAALFSARKIYPGHFGTYRVALDSPADALPRFARACRELGLPCFMPQIPKL
jgi:L-ascorbate metabolism protein UlaG (beta-lactamase superfamily)